MKHKHDLLVFGIVFVIILIAFGTRLYTHNKISKSERYTKEYLSINGWRACLDTKTDTVHNWCLPESQPQSCNDQAWKQLSKLELEKC